MVPSRPPPAVAEATLVLLLLPLAPGQALSSVAAAPAFPSAAEALARAVQFLQATCRREGSYVLDGRRPGERDVSPRSVAVASAAVEGAGDNASAAAAAAMDWLRHRVPRAHHMAVLYDRSWPAPGPKGA